MIKTARIYDYGMSVCKTVKAPVLKPLDSLSANDTNNETISLEIGLLQYGINLNV
jgi:hypothetical protein